MRVGRMWLWLGLLLAATALACNVPLNDLTTVPPPPTAGATIVVPDPPAVSPSAPSPTAAATAEPLPTFTPISLAPTATPRGTPAATATSAPDTVAPTATLRPGTGNPPPAATATPTPTATATEAPSTGPLALSYDISWRLAQDGTGNAIATVLLRASGGNGDYRYFHDDQEVDGPVFEYRWAACRGNPGSFRVDSADGQSFRVNYYENPPCP